MPDWLVFFGFMVLAAIVVGIVQGVHNKSKVASILERVQELADFAPADTYVSVHNFAGVAIDTDRREVALIDKDEIRRFQIPSIISCEVLQDDMQLAYANRGSQLAGVAVGGVLLGGIGAVIGGLTGSKRNVKNVRKILLRFVTDDFNKPNHDIVLFDWTAISKKGVSQDSIHCDEALKAADLWHSRMRALMQTEA